MHTDEIDPNYRINICEGCGWHTMKGVSHFYKFCPMCRDELVWVDGRSLIDKEN